MNKDLTSKEAIKSITYDIATHILKLNLSKEFEFVDKELQRIEKREADIVALCEIDGKEKILHLEIQNSNDNTMPRRMLRYYNDIKMRFSDLDVLQYIIYIGREKMSMKDNIQENQLSFRYNIIDMHDINCEELIKLDTPDALILSILCDFQGKDELDVLLFLITRLQELTKDDEHLLGKYMLMMETLSTNRDLKDKLKEAEKMLREIKYENLPSYDIGMEKGIEKGIVKGIEEGIFKTNMKNALIMINDFNLSPKDVAEKLDLPLDKLESQITKGKK